MRLEERFWRWWRHCQTFGHTSGQGTTRLAFTPPDIALRHWLAETWTRLGLRVTIDGVGNVVGLLGTPPYLLIGSHTDTVPRGGDFDGVLGVIAGTAIAADWELPNGLLLVDWSCEESSRFGVSTVGSRYAAGELVFDDMTAHRDADGISLAEAARDAYGFGRTPTFALSDVPIRAALELHIEQGRVLVNKNWPVAIVDTIAAPERWLMTLTGEPNHSGATQMADRHDALAAAAEVILTIERLSREFEHLGIRATVAHISVSPGVANVVPGEARLLMDVRVHSPQYLSMFWNRLDRMVLDRTAVRQIDYQRHLISSEEPGILDPALKAVMKRVLEKNRLFPGHIASWPSHDSLPLSRHLPTAMLFVRNQSGRSHHPDERAVPDDVNQALTIFNTIVQETANTVMSA